MSRDGARLKRIAILMEGRVEYERNVLRGIREFAAEHPDWLLRLERPGPGTLDALKEWQPHGVLYQAAGLPPKVRKRLKKQGIPSVQVSDSLNDQDSPCVGLDNPAVGEAAADYFLEQRLWHYAWIGVQEPFAKLRGSAFVQRLEEAGEEVATLELPDQPDDEAVTAWLKNLPTPCAVFTAHDECSLYITTLSRSAGLSSPEDLAILGVDNDTLICELASTRLSSVAVPSRRVGREAAGMLSMMIEEEDMALGSRLLLPPVSIITRHSTDIQQTGDEVVNRALRFMRDHLDRRPNIAEVLDAVGVSRRLLERRFQHHLGRSPHQELQRLRMQQARSLLTATRLPLREVAVQCGCRDASQLVTLFRKETGMTPGKFREAAVKRTSNIER